MSAKHVFNNLSAFIGGDDSPHPGDRRPVAACANTPCIVFRKDDGSLAYLNSIDEAPAECDHAPRPAPTTPMPAPPDPCDWKDDHWALLIEAVRLPDAREWDLLEIRLQVAGRPGASELVRFIKEFHEAAAAPRDPGASTAALEAADSRLAVIAVDAGTLAATEEFKIFVARRAQDRVQFHDPVHGRVPWAPRYLSAIRTEHQRWLSRMPPNTPYPPLSTLLKTTVVWAPDPELMVTDLRAFHAKAGLLALAAILLPHLWVPFERQFYASTFSSIAAGHLAKLVLGRLNMTYHLEWRRRAGPGGDPTPATILGRRAREGSLYGPRPPPPIRPGSQGPGPHRSVQQQGPASQPRSRTANTTRCADCGRLAPPPTATHPTPRCHPCRKK